MTMFLFLLMIMRPIIVTVTMLNYTDHCLCAESQCMADTDKIFGALRHRKREREMKRYRLRGEADSPEGKEVREMTSGQLVTGVWWLSY